MRLELFKKDDIKNINKQHSKITFNGIHISYENCDSFSIRLNEVRMDKPICLGIAMLELSKLHMYETYYDKLQPYFGQENFQLLYKDTDVFVFSVNTEDFIADLKNLEDIFDYSILDENRELLSNKNKK